MADFFNFNFDKLGPFSVKKNMTILSRNFDKVMIGLNSLLSHINTITTESLVVKSRFNIDLTQINNNFSTISPNLIVKLTSEGSFLFKFIEFKDLRTTIIQFSNGIINSNYEQMLIDYKLIKSDENIDKVDIIEFFIDTDIITDINLIIF